PDPGADPGPVQLPDPSPGGAIGVHVARPPRVGYPLSTALRWAPGVGEVHVASIATLWARPRGRLPLFRGRSALRSARSPVRHAPRQGTAGRTALGERAVLSAHRPGARHDLALRDGVALGRLHHDGASGGGA